MKSNAASFASSRRTAFLFSVGIVLIAANLRAPITSLGPVLGDVQRELGLNDAAGGLLSALPLAVFAIVSLVAPASGRKLGAERALGAALVAILTGTLFRSLAIHSAVWVGTLVISAGIAVANVLLPGLVKRRSPKHAASLIGIYAAAMALFAGLGAGLAVPIAHIPGSSWRVSLGVWSVCAAIALLAWLPQMRSGHREVRSPASAALATNRSPWTQAIGWQVSAFFAFQSIVFYSIVSWYATIAASRGVSPASAGVDLLLFQIVAIATNLGAAPIIKRAKDQRFIGAGCGLLYLAGSVGMMLDLPFSTLWLLVAGLGAGLSLTTSLSLFALRSASHEQAAELSGMAQFVGYGGGALGPIVFGVLHEMTSNWTYSLAILVAASMLVTLFAYQAGRDRTMV
ncbi:MFS transporter, CP family, cyanate transporter [Paraburkholderia fungorum]|uniref:MFS transporter, CP family, cyanate transporter n=1 Tax=Paraburkholderia fungorum TaxID=134537 RepID=A0A1H1JEX0_9BURK|nr:MFS transporter [Paraburkholderia fungorum]SDR48549.1 MFS transporter, CP family, cyanate transporter [Paraburkholderia fungorum]